MPSFSRISFLLATVLPGVAVAGVGDHIRVGDVTIAPDLDFGAEYRTNVYQHESEPEGGVDMIIQPGLSIVVGNDNNEFSFGGEYRLKKYFDKNQTSLDRFNDFGVNASAHLLKKSIIGFKIGDVATLRNNVAEDVAADNPYHTQLNNTLNAAVSIQPGPILNFDLGGFWKFTDYRVPETGSIRNDRHFNSRNIYGPSLDIKWKFFPSTAVVGNVQYLWHTWEDNWISSQTTTSSFIGDYLAVPDSQHFKFDLGLRGQLTKTIAVHAVAGYGVADYSVESVETSASNQAPEDPEEIDATLAGFDADASGLDGLRVDVGVEWKFIEQHKLSVNYRKDFTDSFFTNYAAYNQVSAVYAGQFGKFVGLQLEFLFRDEQYHGEVERSDALIRGRGDVTFKVQKWLSFTTGAWWTQRASSVATVEYDDVNIHLYGTFTY